MSISARVNNKRTNQKEEKSSNVKITSVILLVIVATGAALYFAFVSEKTLAIQYQVSRAMERQRELKESARRLRVELNHLKSPERLEPEGVRLGLASATPAQIRELK